MSVAPGCLVDAHQHVWTVARGDYGWLSPASPIYRDYGLDDLRPELAGPTATILVQAAPTEAETRFLLDVASASAGLVRGVVGWVDLAAPVAPGRIAALARAALVKGVRPMLGYIDDTGWILRPELRPALAALAWAGLSLDLPAWPRHLPLIPDLARRHADLAMVIDHGGKPDIAAGSFRTWADDIAVIAGETHLFCKLSGLTTRAPPDWTDEDLRPYVEHLLACFGPDRLMWGSDWPVLHLAGGITRWREAALRLIPAAVHDAVMRTTATRFYRI